MTETLIICITATTCLLATLAVANYRLGQYLNPPVKPAIDALTEQNARLQTELNDIRTRINKITIDKGMR